MADLTNKRNSAEQPLYIPDKPASQQPPASGNSGVVTKALNVIENEVFYRESEPDSEEDESGRRAGVITKAIIYLVGDTSNSIR